MYAAEALTVWRSPDFEWGDVKPCRTGLGPLRCGGYTKFTLSIKHLITQT